MSRVKSHHWDNRNGRRVRGRYGGWDRRVTWYCASYSERDKNIRLRFEDEEGVISRDYQDRKEDAERDYNDFRNGALTTTMLRKGK